MRSTCKYIDGSIEGIQVLCCDWNKVFASGASGGN